MQVALAIVTATVGGARIVLLIEIGIVKGTGVSSRRHEISVRTDTNRGKIGCFGIRFTKCGTRVATIGIEIGAFLETHWFFLLRSSTALAAAGVTFWCWRAGSTEDHVTPARRRRMCFLEIAFFAGALEIGPLG
jgi:hypothetical protein